MLYSIHVFLLCPFLWMPQAISLTCMQCGGEAYGGGLHVLRSACCVETPVECASGLACLRATVNSPEMQFILSGCHPPEDGLIGCDTHLLPFNATIQRCVCLDGRCQSYFPGNCPSTDEPLITTTLSSSVFTNLVYGRNSVEDVQNAEDEYNDVSEESKEVEMAEMTKLTKLDQHTVHPVGVYSTDSRPSRIVISPSKQVRDHPLENTSALPSFHVLLICFLYFCVSILVY